MNKLNALAFGMVTLYCITGCQHHMRETQAIGIIEAEEITVYARSTGILHNFDIDEGLFLKEDSLIGIIDTAALHLQREAEVASLKAGIARRINTQSSSQALAARARANKAISEQHTFHLEFLKKYLGKYANVIGADGITQQKFDEINLDVNMTQKEVDRANWITVASALEADAQRSETNRQNRIIAAEIDRAEIQVRGWEEAISRCLILNPKAGKVIYKYAHDAEYVREGQQLYTIGDYTRLKVRSFIPYSIKKCLHTGDSLSILQGIAGERTVSKNGVICWISDRAEYSNSQFITLEQKDRLVYAITIQLDNGTGKWNPGNWVELNFPAR